MPRFGSGIEKRNIGDLRRSQLITTFGCGALSDFPRFSGIMSGLDDWKIGLLNDNEKIHERNLEQLLGKEFFVQPSSPDVDSPSSFGLPALRFPYYYYCPECHMLDYVSKIGRIQKNNQAICNSCGSKLIPSRFVASCINGHIQDFPYIWWVHRNKGRCDNPKLELQYKGTTGGLDSIHIHCQNCDAEETMEGCMGKNALKGLKCKGNMPWLGKTYIDPEDCNAQLRTLQRSATNVYYAVNESTLTIPPWSNIIQEAINKKYFDRLGDIWDEDEEDVKLSRLKKLYAKVEIGKYYGCSEEVFIREVYRRFSPNPEEDITDKSIIIDEYEAFCGNDVDEDHYFKITSEPAPEIFTDLIDQIKLVKRLREVQVLKGFRRIFPEYPEYEEDRKGLFDRDFTPLSKQPLQWLPAVELLGEGIFIKFKENALQEWETRFAHRYIEMTRRLKERNIGKGMYSPRYVLLHTFSHLLIRQLSFQCGYATASLKEKIYSTYPDINKLMSGILIYTATTDSDGSLGGLVREGRSERIENTIKAILQEASWCSNDPICIESKAQGFDSLNYAACHACTLLPETSCEARNCLLDRASITGTPDNKKIGFFSMFL